VKVLGLTGGIGMGKSTADQLLRQRGIAVVDTDVLARELVEPGQPALAEIKKVFGGEMVDAQGRLRRDELARKVFVDAEARKQLEAILHPRIRDRWRKQVETWRKEGRPLSVVVIPLLFKTHAEKELDATICIACSEPTQRQRLLARGWSEEEIKQRIRAQCPIEQKIAKADYLIWTEAGMEVHAAQLERILQEVVGSAREALVQSQF